jgi:hypothetical protein
MESDLGSSFNCARCEGLSGPVAVTWPAPPARRRRRRRARRPRAIRPELAPLADALLAMDNPLSGLTWLHPRQGRSGSTDDLLRRLGRGEIQLTHEAFNGLQP